MKLERRSRTDTILLTAGLLLLGYFLGDVLLLVFAAIVLAVGLDGLGRWLSTAIHVSRGWAVLAAGLGITLFAIGALGLSVVRLAQQVREVVGRVGELFQQVRRWLDGLGALDIEDTMNGGGGLGSWVGDLAGTMMSWGVTAAGAVTNLTLVVVLTMFLVANPDLYRRGAVALVPPEHRNVMQDTLTAIAFSLRWWFLGQVASMVMVGVTVGLGTFVLGIDLWLALGVMTALLAIVPYVGTLLAAVPILAVGFAKDMQTGVIVLVGYIVLQTIEGEIVTPMIHQRAVNLAPALLIATQVLFGVLFGVAGLILAAPLTVVAMVAVQKLWVEHTLGDTTD